MENPDWERKVALAGVGWVIAGALSVFLSYVVALGTIRTGPTNPYYNDGSTFMYIGIVVLITGLCIILVRKRIATYAVKLQEKRR